MTEFMRTPKTFTDGLPDTVKIGPIVYQIMQIPSPTVPHSETGEAMPVFGKISFKEAVITIDEELEASVKWQVYFHEIVHALMEVIGFAGADGGPDEGVIDAMAYAMMSYMIDNGFLTKLYFPSPESSKCQF
jgi:hypothetical protein